MIDDDFVSNLPTEPLSALKAVAEYFRHLASGRSAQEYEKVERDGIQLFALSTVLIRKHSIMIHIESPILGSNRATNINALSEYFVILLRTIQELNAKDLLQTALSRYESELDLGFHYEFSDGEFARLQELINELRGAITEAAYLDNDHRQRLQKRLEKLQAELHMRMSDLDVILGGVAEIGAAINRFGEDAKPLVARLREIGEIVAPVFRRAENLPPGPEFPLLPKSDDSDD